MPGWLAPLGELKGYKDPPSAQKFRIPVEEHGLLLTGAPDAIFERVDGTLVIADYKTSRHTQNQDRLFPMYRVQLNAYAYIARKLGWNAVSALALIYTEPVTTDEAAVEDAARREDGFALGFAAKIVSVELEEAMLAPLFARAAAIHALEAPPAGREGCEDCGYFEKIRGLLG
jgi:RecB family exonuclease